MKLLIISHRIYPAKSPRSYRATELAKEFARRGYEVTLCGVLGNYNYTHFEKEHHLKIKSIGKMRFVRLNSDGVEMSNFFDKVLKKILKKWIDYPDIEFLFKVNSFLKENKGFDTVISIGMPHSIHWGTAYAKKRLGLDFPKKWIADCGDPYMGNKAYRAKPPFYFGYLEKFFCRNTNFITVPTKESINGYYPEFRKKIKVIPQGFQIKKIYNKNPANNTITFAYSGVFYKDFRDPTLLMSYLSNLNKPFKFIVYTSTTKILEPFKEALGDKLEIRGYIERENLLEVLSDVDFLINIENNSNTQSPSKIIDYIITGRPVFSLKSDYLDIDKFNRFLKKDYSGKLNLENIEKYKIENVVSSFEKLLSTDCYEYEEI